MNLPALSIKQPWADWIADGRKTIETRTWSTAQRGPLLVVSSLSLDGRIVRWANDHDRRLREYLQGCRRGVALCVVNLVDCRPMTVADEAAAGCQQYPGAWAWCFAGLWPVRPFRVRGRLGLYRTPVAPEAFAERDIYDEVRRLALEAERALERKGAVWALS